MSATIYAHLTFDAHGEPIIEGTRAKVRMIALDHSARGWNAEEIQRNYPHLTLGQIHSALAYYHDHQAEMDADLHARRDAVERLRSQSPETPGRRKLRERGDRP